MVAIDFPSEVLKNMLRGRMNRHCAMLGAVWRPTFATCEAATRTMKRQPSTSHSALSIRVPSFFERLIAPENSRMR